MKALNEISVPVPQSDIPRSVGGSEKPGLVPAVQEKVSEPAPLAAIPTVSEPGPDIAPLSVSVPRSDSRASTNQSDDFSSPPSSISHSREEGSEAGMETEEDEGMVLVGRPNKP